MKHLFTLFLAAIACNSSFAQVPAYADTNGLVAWYAFDSNVNNSYGAPMNNGVVYGDVTYGTDRFGAENHCYHGDGMSAINIPINNFPGGNSARTVSAFFKSELPYAGGNQVIFACGNNYDLGGRWGLFTKDTSIGMEYYYGGVLSSFEHDSAWHNLVVTYPDSGAGSSDVKIYVDGDIVASYILLPVTSFHTDTGYMHYIGAINCTPPESGWVGDLDDVAVWNRELSACEIKSMYHSIVDSVPVISQTGTTLNTSPTYTAYQWELDGVPISGATSASYTPTDSGSYQVIVTTTDGCHIDTSSVFTFHLPTTGLTNMPSANDIVVYPNPSGSIFTIHATVEVNVILTSIVGETLLKKEDAKNLDLGNMPPGPYLLSIYDLTGARIKTEKISWLGK